MKFSEQWLRELVNPAIETKALVDSLTMAGLEVDAVEAAAGEFSGVVVGEIVAIEQHPDADKLRVCQVAGNGDEPTQVVCGAPNAALGLKIPFATVGAVLPGNFKIKKAKLRGVESFGMLCGASEIGMEDEVDGLMVLAGDAPVGTNIREYLNLDDNIIEVDLTPNRGDCLSIKGLAREVGVLEKAQVSYPAVDAVAPQIDDKVEVQIEAGVDCPRYAGRVIKGVDVKAATPLWMVEKLRRSGIRSIDPVVDITNYVLLELGQPMHAFDLAKIAAPIVVRKAQAAEKLTLLDEQELELREESLVIADQSQALALAGIMGGLSSSVTSETQDILFESAFFAPVAIAGRARSYGLHTDSSHRFERGVDFDGQEAAIERATALVLEICGGQAGPIVVAEKADNKPELPAINLRRDRIKRLLGFELADAEVGDILTRLGMALETTADGWLVTPPSYRFDVRIEADLLEELARVYGYNNLPVTKVKTQLDFAATQESQTPLADIRRSLVSRGYQEAITYTFIEPKLQAMFDPQAQAVELKNPISADMSVMRTSLWPGLVSSALHNLKRQRSRVRLFESGLKFYPEVDGQFPQTAFIAGLLTGSREPESWNGSKEQVDFYDIKADVEAILALSGDIDSFSFEAGQVEALHPGQTAIIKRNGERVGVVGALHPELQKQLGLSQNVYLFELEQAKVCDGVLPSFKELSKFPEVRRDLAIIINQDISAADVSACVKANAGEQLKHLVLFDVYQGKGIDLNQKSLALGLVFQAQERTLDEQEVNQAIDTVVNALEQNFQATLRK